METIVVDWGYAISTLIIRFVGIFVVLGILQAIMQITGRIFAKLDAKKTVPPAASSDGLTQQDAAAIGMALFLHQRNR